MGVQQFGPRKIAQISKLCHMELEMVWNTQGTTTWYEARTPGDRHVMVNVRTGEVEPIANPTHMTSCSR